MVKTKEEILEAIKGKIGEDTSDETIALLEDISDTLNDYDTKTKDSTEWKTKYEENDKAWREKYTNRFFNNEDEGEDGKDIPDELLGDKPTSFESLFAEVKE
jgi:hypothetical protein